MRTAAEIRFRLRQEIANVVLLVRPPVLRSPTTPRRLPLLPDPEPLAASLRATAFACELEQIADSVLRHVFPLLGSVIETGPEIRWRRDYIGGIETEPVYFRRLPYLDSRRVGDHKIIWELNRHQHLVALAQAWIIYKRRPYITEIEGQLTSWWNQNPFGRGINWTSALEVAIRALSWVWIWHLAGPELSPAVADRLRLELYRHGVHLENNLSVYFSPNTHLLGEAVALHALGLLFPAWPRSRKWRELGGSLVAAQMDFQVREDGSHFEQSSAYQVYAIDFFLLHAILAEPPAPFLEKLSRMADYLAALSGKDLRIPLMGDDDGGRLFYPFGDRRRFGAASLASCSALLNRPELPYAPEDLAIQAAWWLGRTAPLQPEKPGESGAQLFRDAGVAILSQAPLQLIADTRAFGHGGAGHSHAHALQIVCKHGHEDVLIDPGTFTYVAEPDWRDRFRGTAAHNTVLIDGLDQADAAGPFRWNNPPPHRILEWRCEAQFNYLAAECCYRGFRHIRHLVWIIPLQTLTVVDVVAGPAGEHTIQQTWNCNMLTPTSEPTQFRISTDVLLQICPVSAEQTLAVEQGWHSEAPGQRAPHPVIASKQTSRLPAFAVAFVSLGQSGENWKAAIEDRQIVLQQGGIALHFQREGDRLTLARLKRSADDLGDT